MKTRTAAHTAALTALVLALGMSSQVSAQAATTGQAARPQAAQDASDANSVKAQAVEKLALQIMETPTYTAAVAKAPKDFQANEYANNPDFLRYVTPRDNYFSIERRES